MATTKVVVNIPQQTSYDVRIGPDLIAGLGNYLRSFSQSNTALVITDSHVGKLYLEQTKESLKQAEYKVFEITIPAGENSKTTDCVAEIWKAMSELKLSRDSLVVALGGGVIGDMAGFAASTYMRGIDFVQVPTSLLAMVDSSVGGKTGVNLPAGKNLIGTFKQPSYVCASTTTLKALPEREWICGYAEIIKTAVIDEGDFFFWLSDVAPQLNNHDEEIVSEAIARCVIEKANIVALDETESKGVRECLNYGHTLGHAIELLAGYGTFSHGQAVAEGMRFAARLAVEVLDASLDFVRAQDELLDTLKLPTLAWSAPPQEMLDALLGDKKVRRGSLRFMLPRDVGDWEIVEVSTDLVLEHLEAWQKSK